MNINSSRINLNDFKSFEQCLFSKAERKLRKKEKWKKYYDEYLNLFYPPISDPKTIEDYQLNHYALWMVIYVFNLTWKPNTINNISCYPCNYAYKKGKASYDVCYNDCPLVVGQKKGHCGFLYYMWEDEYKESMLPVKKIISYAIAHYKWRKP